MKSSICALLVCFSTAIAVDSASAGTVDFEFTATPDSGPLFDIADADFNFYALTMSPDLELTGNPSLTYPLNIESLELEITGLTHENLEDLTIILLDPLTRSITVMSELGGMNPFTGTLVFNDDGAPLPAAPSPINPAGGPYLPEGGRFADVPFDLGRVDTWTLFIYDDSEGDVGSFASWTLRGTVPEPATLALFAIGALALARRKRHHR